ncbi:reverse transcriptase domain-containing protein [Tanacetum coccineum]
MPPPIGGNHDQAPPPVAPIPLPAPDLRTMGELCQPTMNGRGRSIAPVHVQATDFRLKNHMIQQVQNSCQFHGLSGDDGNKHLDKFLTVTKSMKQNGVSDDALRLYLFLYSLTHHATDTSAERGESSRSTTSSSSEIAALTQQMAEMRKDMMGQNFNQGNYNQGYNQNQGQNFNHTQSNFNQNSPSTEVLLRQHILESDAKFQLLANQMTKMEKPFNERPQGALPSNTVLNPRKEIKAITTRSGITLAGASIPPPPSSSSSKEVEQDPEPIMDQEKLQDKSDIQIHKFWQMFKKLHINISIAEALTLMPKYTKMLKDLLSNKEKLLELADTPLNENCSTVLLKKSPEKLRDPGRFLIPCVFSKLGECMALADLGKFSFPVDFIIVNYDVDPRVPLILGRPFLRMACALVDVHGEKLTLRVVDENLTLNPDNTSKYPHKHRNESVNMIDIMDITCEDQFQKVLKIKKSIPPLSDSTTYSFDHLLSLTSFKTSDSLLEEFVDELALIDLFPSENDDIDFDPESDLRETKFLLNRDPSIDSSSKDDIDKIDSILEEFPDEASLSPSLSDSFPPGNDDDDDDLFDF